MPFHFVTNVLCQEGCFGWHGRNSEHQRFVYRGEGPPSRVSNPLSVVPVSLPLVRRVLSRGL
jgi:hypothetical protein